MEKVAHVGGAPAPLNNLIVGVASIDLFFVISGFVMVYASESLFAQRGAPRIFFAAAGADRAAVLGGDGRDRRLSAGYARHGGADDVVFAQQPHRSFLFYPYLRPDGLVSPVHALGWTLNYEMFFYVLFAVASCCRGASGDGDYDAVCRRWW